MINNRMENIRKDIWRLDTIDEVFGARQEAMAA